MAFKLIEVVGQFGEGMIFIDLVKKKSLQTDKTIEHCVKRRINRWL
jgi:hypothetical protein